MITQGLNTQGGQVTQGLNPATRGLATPVDVIRFVLSFVRRMEVRLER